MADRSMTGLRRPIAWAAAAGLLLAPAAARACRCVPVTAAEAARRADAVVLATVEAVAKDRPHYAEYTVRVTRAWKARLPERLTVKTRQTTCAADFTPGARYLVYLRRGAAGWETSGCSGNLPAEEAAAALRALKSSRR